MQMNGLITASSYKKKKEKKRQQLNINKFSLKPSSNNKVIYIMQMLFF